MNWHILTGGKITEEGAVLEIGWLLSLFLSEAENFAERIIKLYNKKILNYNNSLP